MSGWAQRDAEANLIRQQEYERAFEENSRFRERISKLEDWLSNSLKIIDAKEWPAFTDGIKKVLAEEP